MTVWFDRDGRQIEESEAAVRGEDPAYCQVARTVVADPGVAGWTFEVLTIWLGLNVAEQEHRMELFETRVFSTGGSVNRPGMSGDSVPWEGWSHVREYVEEVPGRAA